MRSTASNLAFLITIAAAALWIQGSQNTSSTCPDGFIAIPGDTNLCVMQYEAQQNPSTGLPMSKPGIFPWNFQSPVGAKNMCEDLGAGYHLMTSTEWMQVANDILATPINDLSEDPSVQLAIGNSAGMKRVQAPPASNPSLEKCDLTIPLSSEQNSACALRGQLPYSAIAGSWEQPYTTGQVGRNLMRTHVLSNGEVIWDFTGNLWEWMGDDFVFEDKTGQGETFEEDADGLTGTGIHASFPITKTRWIEHNQVETYGNLAGSNPPDASLTSANGIGNISLNPGWSWDDASSYTTPFKAVGRGGAWANNENSGIYSVNLALGPSYSRNYTGFRCAKTLR